jgi:hypothetical protein
MMPHKFVHHYRTLLLSRASSQGGWTNFLPTYNVASNNSKDVMRHKDVNSLSITDTEYIY